ncbi:hypothetical protein WJX74_007056 [Apatococcus lobatus]|uniref:UspA domain-containing protein n=2 Tax=Apatococcus TaxID=904362 RepID=A0AAW1T2D4_9CHLO
MAGGAEQLKPVLIAVDTEEASLRALAWALDQFAFGTNPSSIHLVHVVRTLSTQLEVYLGCGPGSAYNFSDPTPHHEIQDVVHAKEFLHNRVVPIIDSKGLQHELHLFVETATAPAKAIFEVIEKVAAHIKPVLVVIGCNNKSDDLILGPVAKLCQTGLDVPVALVR